MGEGAPEEEVKGHSAERPQLGRARVQAAHGEESSRLTEQGGGSAGHRQQHFLRQTGRRVLESGQREASTVLGRAAAAGAWEGTESASGSSEPQEASGGAKPMT